jgi:hypothetical protein
MRAYHRVDPLMDERKSDYSPAQLGAFLKVQLVAGRQAERGRFRSRKALEGALPAAYARHVAYLLERGDLVTQPDGSVYVDGWDEWQEGDLNVGERMRRLRARHRDALERNEGRNGQRHDGVTRPSPAAIGVGIGVSVDDVALSETSSPRSASGARIGRAIGPDEGLPHLDPVTAGVGEQITGRGVLAAGAKQLTELDRLIEAHGPDAVQAAMRRVANGGRLEWRQLVWGIVKDLEPIPGARRETAEEREDREVAELKALAARRIAERRETARA